MTTIALVALFAAGLTVVLRAVPPFKALVFSGVKPWACDLCMSWWNACAGGVLALGGGLWGPISAGTLVTWVLGTFAAVPVSMLVLRFVSQPTGHTTTTFDLPPANDNDGEVLR